MLYLTRHGQTDWNLYRRYQGATDIKLNEKGREQAHAVREGLKDIKFDRVISSPRIRAVESASIISGMEANQIETYDELGEAGLGDWEGRYEESLRAELGDKYDDWRQHAGLVPTPNGETLFHVMARLYLKVEDWLSDAHDKNILVVAHQGTNAAILMLVTELVGVKYAKLYRQTNSQVDIVDPKTRKIVKTHVFDDALPREFPNENPLGK